LNADLRHLTKALSFAAEAHRNQRRKGAAQEPYINHLIEVLDLVVQNTSGDDANVLIAALLHDVLEDTPTTYEVLAKSFGERVAEIVRENSDDMTLPKAERRRARIAAMASKSREARIVKMADLISNLRAIAVSPPAGWSAERKLGYLEGCRQLVDAARGTEASIERIFDETAAGVERAISDDAPFHIDGSEVASRHLDSEIGQPVHLVYLLNTEDRAFGPADVDHLCDLLAQRFPAATVQPAEAVYERGRRSILMARIRTDSTDAVVDLAQRLCVEFQQRFVGIEVDGRYIRIYSDDTA
jgi:HD domain-containing protein